MSIASEITRINNNIASAYTAANSKGATLPATQNSANLATCINSITVGGGSTYTRPTDWLTIPTLDTTKDDIYILNGVLNNGLNMIFLKVSGTGVIDWGDGSATETFTRANKQGFSHHYNYTDINSNTWTSHNNARQVLVHISGNRGSITYFSTAVQYTYINADGVSVNYNSSSSSDIYEIKADVSSSEVYCAFYSTTPAYSYHKNLEIFDWKGTITNSDMNRMFSDCYSLRLVPQLDTSRVTNMTYMFSGCYSLQLIPQIDTSRVTNMVRMFGDCYSLQLIPQLDTSKVTSMNNTFNGCRSLQTIPQIDTSRVTNMNSMFSGCYSLQLIPQIDTSKVTNMSNMFSNCYSLQIVPQIDASSVTTMGSIFNNCYQLQEIKLFGLNPNYTSGITFSNLTNSTMITKQALVDLFNSIAVNTDNRSRTIQMGSTLQGYLANCYVKDSGVYYTAILPTKDTSVQSGKTYYTYDQNTDIYTQVVPDFSSDTFYYELKTATWNKYVICQSTDTGAVLALDFARNIKKYTIS